MLDSQDIALKLERVKIAFQGAVVGAVSSDAAAMIMNAPMNARLLCSFATAAVCAVLADKYIAKPTLDRKPE